MHSDVDLAANPNTHWAGIFVNELVLCGIQAICFAPGSRSTPLVLAVAANPALHLYRHLDERSAGFFALGMAKAGHRPVALICTSGTAVANFLPAVIEAHQSRIPLIVLSADRPPELRGSGANQTIDQLKLFGDHVRLFMDLPVPQEDAPAVVLRHLRTAAARAVAAASGPPAGPVHLNFPFRKPLEPVATGPRSVAGASSNADQQTVTAYTQFAQGDLQPSAAQVTWLADLIASEPDGLIICGPNCPGDTFATDVTALARTAGYPIVADPLSGLRHGPHVDSCSIVGGYDLLLKAAPDAWPMANVILRFGEVPTSAPLNAYLERIAPEHYIHIRRDGVWADDLHLVRQYWHMSESDLCAAVCRHLVMQDLARDGQSWRSRFTGPERIVWDCQTAFQLESPLYDGGVTAQLLAGLPAHAVLFAGNSLAIRHIDAYDRPSSRPLALYGNRGASGIDGNVSTAIGIAAGSGDPVVALLGDITFYHDMNGLLALKQPGMPPVTFVILNNEGGGIFRRLPVAAYEPAFSDLFLTPHGLTFEHAAALYGLAYRRVAADGDFQHLSAAAQSLGKRDQSSLIEVMTDGRRDLELYMALVGRVSAAMTQAQPAMISSNT